MLRWRCDARSLRPLPIEIIARRKVALAFEPQKVSRRTAPVHDEIEGSRKADYLSRS
jgi:hypothetical protein